MESEVVITANKAKRQRGMETQLVHIPDEILDDILSRLLVKSLMQFKCVCKHWLSRISNPNFCHKTMSESILLVEKSESLTISLYSLDDDKFVIKSFSVPCNEKQCHGKKVIITNSCNGLVIIGLGESFFLFNPLTRYLVKVLALNCQRHNDIVVAGLCYDASTNDYKVVIRFTHRFGRGVVVAVASLKIKRWVQIKFPFDVASLKAGPIVNGRMHWTVNDGVNNQYPRSKKIICFDPRANLFEEFPSPQSNTGNNNDIMGLGVLGGCLYLARKSNFDIELLIMKEYGVGISWTPLNRLLYYSWPFHSTKNGEILRQAYVSGRFAYDWEKQKMREVDDEILQKKNMLRIFAYNPEKRKRRNLDMLNGYNLSDAILLDQNLGSPTGYEWDEIRHANRGWKIDWPRN